MIKYILFVLYILVSPLALKVEAKNRNCLSFMPYFLENNLVQLMENSEFCVKDGKRNISIVTGGAGERIIDVKDDGQVVIAFGESQLLGFDASETHHLLRLFPGKGLKLFAAPNNSPNDSISRLEELLTSSKIESAGMLIGFNWSTDFFRLLPEWDVKNLGLWSREEASFLVDYPFLGSFLIIKDYIFDRGNIRTRLENEDDRLGDAFLKVPNKFFLLENFAKKFGAITTEKPIDLLIYRPFWLHSDIKNFRLVEEEYSKAEMSFLCLMQKFNPQGNIYIADVQNRIAHRTLDNRHLLQSEIFFIQHTKSAYHSDCSHL